VARDGAHHNKFKEARRMTTTDDQRDMTIVDCTIEIIRSDHGDLMYVLVTLEDGTKHRFVDLPVGRLHLERRNLVRRSFTQALRQAVCWLQAADMGVHRIIGIEKIGPIEGWADLDDKPNGNWEVVARMSDGSRTRVFVFYDAELSFDERELLDLSIEQAEELKNQKDRSYRTNGEAEFDYSGVHYCLACGPGTQH
jgi:hypothetical protein